MCNHRNTFFTRAAALAATALALAVVSGSAFGSTIIWKGVTFETQGSGTATVDSNDDLLLTPTGNSFGLHVNRLPSGGNAPSLINANGTPFISFSYIDPDVGGEKIDFSIQDETVTGKPRIQAGSLFDASQVVSATYGDKNVDRNAN